ncbi:MAG: hypothetical protein HC900_07650 [Methylacidiphilales bacterium]|nr:hypothetical protein [Candidatus Methylacidiphilales bacterium]
MLLFAAMACGFGRAEAASIGACEHLDRISFLAEGPRTFSNGKIRVALVDTDGEPVSGSVHVLVFIPEESIGSRCFAVSRTAATVEGGSALGFYDVAWAKLKASYDAQTGLLIVLPYSLYDGSGGSPAGDLRIRIDLRGEGAVRLE